ncbi:hypothetical protein CYMTET_39843 [Cymbomonas tetramitiformis]|uniref:J domain-containing protein n=1 Tax=Cymbomonas tetramitiformis TaxID=36881 RepID=A0AAE0CBH9_9CHLO|nr:hypothetical protein CYMTET_39843 [Cymbomonas tetramitiformis]
MHPMSDGQILEAGDKARSHQEHKCHCLQVPSEASPPAPGSHAGWGSYGNTAQCPAASNTPSVLRYHGAAPVVVQHHVANTVGAHGTVLPLHHGHILLKCAQPAACELPEPPCGGLGAPARRTPVRAVMRQTVPKSRAVIPKGGSPIHRVPVAHITQVAKLDLLGSTCATVCASLYKATTGRLVGLRGTLSFDASALDALEKAVCRQAPLEMPGGAPLLLLALLQLSVFRRTSARLNNSGVSSPVDATFFSQGPEMASSKCEKKKGPCRVGFEVYRFQGMGKYLDAIVDCCHATLLDSKYLRSYQRRADAYISIGDYASACKDLEKLQSLGCTDVGSKLVDARAKGKRSSQIDHYGILGVANSCSAADIKGAYRQLALRHHPDKAANDNMRKVAESVFKYVQQAYAILSDPPQRRKYDCSLHSMRYRYGRSFSFAYGQ